VVAGIRRDGTRELLQVTTPISPGSSGGPVLDSGGRVVGVTVGSLQDGQNLNFAVPASAVAALLWGRPAPQRGLASAVEAAESLMDNRGEYSEDPNSPYQRASRQIRDDLTAAVGRATKDDVELLLRVQRGARARRIQRLASRRLTGR
jgi:S1-C subfamily serine protease